MSRIGKQPIAIPSGVDVSVENNVLKFKKGNHIKELDTLMDEIGCPMSGMEKRTFTKHSQADDKETIPIKDKTQVPRGKLATFAIRIQYRNNASWQGTVKWIEGDAEEYFRSLLELFWLLDSAMKV